MREEEWNGDVTVVSSDMREWDAPEQVNNSSVILMKTLLIFVVILSTLAAAKLMPKKNSGLNGIHIHDLCDIGAVLNQLS